jgi:hypothetical protein
MRILCRLVIGLVFSAALASSGRGATRIVLGDSSAAASSSYANREPRYAVNGAGLVGNLHSNTADKVAWMSATQSSTVSGQWFRVDLGQVVELSHFKLWNFNFWHATVATTNRGIKDAEIYLSSLDTTPGTDFSDAAQWTRVIDKVTFAKAPGLNTYAGEPEVSLAGLQGRWLALRVLSNFSATDFTAGISELQVFAASKPVALSFPPTSVAPDQAILPGALTYDGGMSNTLYAFWGASDGGTASSAWDHVVSLGYQPTGLVSATASVSSNAEYFFRFQAVNADTDSWSSARGFLTAPVAVEMPATHSEASSALPVTFRRPAALTNSPVALNFAVSGTAVLGSDYWQPATSVVMQAGSATAQVQIPIIDDLVAEPPKTLTVGLGPSSCLRDASSTNTTTLLDDEGPLDKFAWHHTMRVTLSGYAGASTLTNFPVPLRLHEGLSGFRYADFSLGSDGGDLRVTDAATGEAVPFEIESWNPSGTSIVWACASRLAGSSTGFFLLWGNTNVWLPNYTTNGAAWDSGFSGVWHLQQPSGIDSTRNRNNGAAFGNISVPALLGSGQYFDGNDYIQVPDSPSIGTNVIASLSVSLWLKADTTLERTNETWRLLEKGDSYFFGQGFNNAGGAVLIVKYTNQVYGAGNGADLSSNEWHHVCGTYDGAMLRLYTDGLLAGSRSLAPSIDDDKLPLRIGSDDSGKYYKGVLDETRIETAVRSPDWIKACYDSQRENSAFVTYYPATRLFKGTIINLH